MSDPISSERIIAAIQRASAALIVHADALTALDQAMGDGDTGITVTKIANALTEYVTDVSTDDVGAFLAGAGMATNRAASSTLGTLTATALIAAGKSVKGQAVVTEEDLVLLFESGVTEIEMRGKAKIGDKTLVDAARPASDEFSMAMSQGDSVKRAGERSLRAAAAGRDRVTPSRSNIGRASWLGDRSIGQVDPGCEAFVVALSAIVEGPEGGS